MDEIASYLSWQAEISEAQKNAARFANRLPWLTSRQREDVIGHYTADWLDLMHRTASRNHEQQHQCALRHRSLRMRWVATLLGLVSVTAGLVAVLAAMLAVRR
ncbi:hypothetical protein [Streptantibioticus ferralitis]|uniref:Uncharacterized protein n=1 Tax=Streptantibioticus ferralitis TaxID=236510 RepID=A0ABT5YZ10_9ACTN|nr:hypothetical protein [Streptantibioticus ferralitis]MDF2256827.1 hypothetical protein [Streptantibioticus ferralitis]